MERTAEKDHFRSRKSSERYGHRNAGSGDGNETQMHGGTEGVGKKKQGKRKSLTHGGYELVKWMPDKGFKDFKMLLILYISVFIWVVVQLYAHNSRVGT